MKTGNQRWSVAVFIFALGMSLGAGARAAEAPPADAETLHVQFVETAFRSLCQRPPDPASLSYYVNVLAEKSRTPAEVHAAIEVTCLRHSQADACRHVANLSDVCPSAVN